MWSLLSKKSEMIVLEAVKGHLGAKNISENRYERVGGPSNFSVAPPIPSIWNLSVPFGNFFPISEKVNNSTQKPPVENPPPEQTFWSSLPPILKLSPISEIVNT